MSKSIGDQLERHYTTEVNHLPENPKGGMQTPECLCEAIALKFVSTYGFRGKVSIVVGRHSNRLLEAK